MLSLILTACSTGTSAVVPMQDNGQQPPAPPAFSVTGAPELDLPERTPCDWPTDDPGDLASTGAEPGDVADELLLWDQCQQPLSSWDLYGRYVLVLSTTAACESCEDSARGLADEADALAEGAGVEVLPLIVLTDDDGTSTPRSAGADYAQALALTGFPVTADPAGASLEALPLSGEAWPGRCVLSPEMVILGCVEGDGDDVIQAWIESDAASG